MPGAPVTASMLTVGLAPAAAMGMTYLAMANSIGLAMENAAAAQQRGQAIGEAATVQVVALIIAVGVAEAAKGG
ncbi:MAG TPA: RebB family R body protein [Allosphingosinicella sp.]|nr:RebB family R body protein [Allosphingosinicella sp.]